MFATVLSKRSVLAVALAAFAVILTGCDTQGMVDGASRAFASAKAAVDRRLNGAPKASEDGAKGKQRGARAHLVELAEARQQTLDITQVYSGSLRARRTVRVFAQEEGRIAALPFYESDEIERGSIVLEIDRALLQAQADKAQAVLSEFEANRKRLEGLRAKRMVGEDEYLRAATAVEVARAEAAVLRTRLGYTRVAAPFSGVLSERLAELGDIVARYDHVLTIIDPDSLVIDISASELLLPALAPGDPVAVRIDALGSEVFDGEVARIFPELDPRTRQGRIEITLKPVPERARAGQFARVTFTVRALAQTVIPFGALRRDREGEHVFVVGDDKRARRTAVRSGRRLADRVEILEGLEPGDAVVLRGFLGLADGRVVKPTAGPKGRASG